MHWSGIGHEPQKEHLARLINEGQLPHALLFHGPRGVGKYGVAFDIATKLLADGLAPVGSPDFMELRTGIDDETGKATGISVDDIKERLRPWAYQRPLYGARKVVLIDDADRMTGDAANMLLKLLEEPPAYLVFLLVSSQAEQVVGTIASRCQQFAFHALAEGDAQRALADLDISPEGRELLRAIAGGQPGIARTAVEGGCLPKITAAIEALRMTLKGGVAERILAAKKFADADDADRVVSWWLAWVRTKVFEHPELAPVAHGLLTLTEAVAEPKYNRRLAFERFLLEIPKY